jgi:hypothetical protein
VAYLEDRRWIRPSRASSRAGAHSDAGVNGARGRGGPGPWGGLLVLMDVDTQTREVLVWPDDRPLVVGFDGQSRPSRSSPLRFARSTRPAGRRHACRLELIVDERSDKLVLARSPRPIRPNASPPARDCPARPRTLKTTLVSTRQPLAICTTGPNGRDDDWIDVCSILGIIRRDGEGGTQCTTA